MLYVLCHYFVYQLAFSAGVLGLLIAVMLYVLFVELLISFAAQFVVDSVFLLVNILFVVRLVIVRLVVDLVVVWVQGLMSDSSHYLSPPTMPTLQPDHYLTCLVSFS